MVKGELIKAVANRGKTVLVQSPIKILFGVIVFLLVIVGLANIPPIPLPLSDAILYIIPPLVQIKLKIIYTALLFFILEFGFFYIWYLVFTKFISLTKRLTELINIGMDKVKDFLDSLW